MPAYELVEGNPSTGREQRRPGVRCNARAPPLSLPLGPPSLPRRGREPPGGPVQSALLSEAVSASPFSFIPFLLQRVQLR